MVEIEDSPGPVKRIFKDGKIRLNGKYQKQYFVRFKNQTADKDKWLVQDSILDGNLHITRLRVSQGLLDRKTRVAWHSAIRELTWNTPKE
ncbi:hypothetical protein O181_038493 [Austropuccinia psidii MF-1]|uniref:Uncharacterized protein n=1 Tax=Austropuccinia psidii MF-1 TaxID=1389203 RepID=A0A9Q3DDG4_9BASI|nr:hypothetical protein [Austropuccinia psidii MF-1]